MPLEFRGLGKVVVDAKNAYDWYETLGFDLTGTRLEKIRHYLEYKLLNIATPEGAAWENGTADEDAYYAVSDGAGFGLIAEDMAKLPSHRLPRGPLKDILQGPLASSDETPHNSDARNKFVELEMAAHCARAGFRLLGFDDLTFEFEGRKYHVECKRPFSANALERNLHKAYAQLRRKLQRDDSRGIIAIAVEKVFNLDQGFQRVRSESHLSEVGLMVADAFRTKIGRLEGSWVDTRVVGVVAIIRFLVKIEGSNAAGFSYNFALGIRALPGVQMAEWGRLNRMVRQLNAGFLS